MESSPMRIRSAFNKATYFLVALLCSFLVACSGNESSITTRPDPALNVVLGITHSGLAHNIEVQGVAVSVNGKLAVDEVSGELSGVRAVTDARGRFALGLNSENPAAVIMFARGNLSDEEQSLIQCKSPLGCFVKQGEGDEIEEVSFGESYRPDYYYDYVINDNQDSDPDTDDAYVVLNSTLWSSALEFVALGQFININPITDMAGAFGYSSYINDGQTGVCDVNECAANQQAPGFFSKYGIVKANTQMADLLGLTDIVSKEPANLAALDTISAANATSLKESIRYGALIAALQQIQLAYDNALANKDDQRFRRKLNEEFAQNIGQLYQKAAPIDQVLTMESWYTAARDLLQAADDHFKGLNKTIPVEVALVISDFDQQIAAFAEGELTIAESAIPEELSSAYANEITYTKAMLNHLTKVADEFSNPEYRNRAKQYQQQIDTMGQDASPAINALTTSMLDLYGYYLSCTRATCDPVNQWHDKFSSYDAASKVLTLKYSEEEGDQLVVSQRIVDLITNDDITEPEESRAIDFIVNGIVKLDNLTVITDFSDKGIGEASMRVSYEEDVAELLADDSLRSLNPSMPAQEANGPIYPAAYEFSFSSLEVQYSNPDNQLNQTLQGAYSWLLRGVNDVTERDAEGKLNGPKRYNLEVLTIVANLEGHDFDSSEESKLTDNVVLSISGNSFNARNYYPDTVFPEWTNYFVPRKGKEVGTSSAGPILTTSIIDYDFPQIDEDGAPVDGSILEGKVQSGKNQTVKMLKFDYLYAGSVAFVVYPQREDGRYLGMICQVPTEYEEYFVTTVENDIIGNITFKDEAGNENNIFTCSNSAFYEGEADVNAFVNLIWDANQGELENWNGTGEELVKIVDVPGEGVYFSDLVTINGDQDLAEFASAETQFMGKMFAPHTLGIDNIRLQVRPQLINQEQTENLADVALDMNLIRRASNVIDVGLFIAYNPEQILNTESGLPYIAAGDNTESYYISYKTTDTGDETGSFIFNWHGAQLIDGVAAESPAGTFTDKVLQDYDPSNSAAEDNFLFNLGSDVAYDQGEATPTDVRCGIFSRGEPSDVSCDAIAYLTFRGFVTGSIREERPGVFVARFLDGSWQIVGE
jgi:hypothetical protein